MWSEALGSREFWPGELVGDGEGISLLVPGVAEVLGSHKMGLDRAGLRPLELGVVGVRSGDDQRVSMNLSMDRDQSKCLLVLVFRCHSQTC